MVTFYHKPNCSTSLDALSILKKKTREITIIKYLETVPTEKELKEILKKLKFKPEQIVRKKEKLYKEKYEGKSISDSQWIKILVKNPILIERPILVKGNNAVIGRPPEKILELFV